MAEEKNYQEAYEKEHIKTADLAERVAVIEFQAFTDQK